MTQVYYKYPIVNTHWKFRLNSELNLHSYLYSLSPTKQTKQIFNSLYANVEYYYIRIVYKMLYKYDDNSVFGKSLYDVRNLDCWNRQFPMFPYDHNLTDSNRYMLDIDGESRCIGMREGKYGFVGFFDDTLSCGAFVITTSVEGQLIHCVDVLS